ncbi:MAG: hypothetical protein MHPSP_003409, partial [Paramarteilia canceri]
MEVPKCEEVDGLDNSSSASRASFKTFKCASFANSENSPAISLGLTIERIASHIYSKLEMLINL